MTHRAGPGGSPRSVTGGETAVRTAKPVTPDGGPAGVTSGVTGNGSAQMDRHLAAVRSARIAVYQASNL